MKFYRALDHLLEMKEEIENHLYWQFHDLFSMEVDLVFYDLTSSYFEGKGPEELACLGYSRDHEPGKPQIVIGLIMCNGLPIGHEVFEGNRVDKKTVKEVLARLKNQFKIKRCIFVGDRGIISKEILRKDEQIRLENELDGVFILRTYEKDLSPEKIIEAYKDLADIERAFRNMKTPLELRPFFHRKEERVKAHVFICVLAFALEKVAEKMLRDRDVKFTPEKVFSLFKQMGAAVMKVGEELYAYTSEPTYTQRRILKTLKIQPPLRVIMEVK